MSLHTQISYIKSTARIIGFVFLLINLAYGVIILTVAEIIGVVEEMVVD